MSIKNYLILSIALAASVTACKQVNPDSTTLVRKVKTEYVKRADTFSVRQFSSVVQERASMNVAFRVAGKIERILVKEGDFVKKGQLIAIMDSRDYQVQANVAKAQYEQVKAEAARVSELYEKKSVAANDFDKATAGLKMVTEQWNHARHQLEDTKLYAPCSGYVQSVHYEEGELVNTGYPVFSVMDVSSYMLSVEVPVDVFLQRESFRSFSCSQAHLPGEHFELSLLNYHKKADANQLYTIDFRLASNNSPLAPGMDVEVDIVIEGNAQNPLYIPLKAVFQKEGKSYVWVFNPEKSDVELRPIVTDGLYGQHGVRIVSGLHHNEQVVVAGVHALNHGQTVVKMEEIAETNKGGLL